MSLLGDVHMRSRLKVLIAGWMASMAFPLGLIALAPPATADDDQFLSHLLTGNMAHPPLTPPALVTMGHQACSDIAGGVSPDVEKDNLDASLSSQGVFASRAEVGTLIHFALRDLCPKVPNTTGI
jgi:Protein of unknown function (DUF732)